MYTTLVTGSAIKQAHYDINLKLVFFQYVLVYLFSEKIDSHYYNRCAKKFICFSLFFPGILFYFILFYFILFN